MLVTKLEHAEANDYLSARMKKAFAFLRENDLESLECGRHVIDGDDVFANVMEFDTVPSDQKDMEAHRLYYDVQYVISGEEILEYVQVEGLEATQDFDDALDFGAYKAPQDVTRVTLRAGDFAVVAPEDAHKPGCMLGENSSHVKKAVVKVRK